MVLCSVLEIGKNLVGKCVGPIAGCVQAEVTHLWNYNANVESLRKEAENLRDATESVKRLIEEAENSRGETLLVDAVVQRWQTRMASLSKEASNIIKDEEKATERCLMGFRPNLWACYLVSKKAKEVIEEAVTLRDERKEFDDRIATVDYSRRLGFKTNPDFKAFESRDDVSNDIVVALKDSSVNMVGVFGMGGVGKTTLVKKVAEQLHKDQIFNCVVMVSVSQNPVLKNIQNEIAEQLGIKLDVDSETVRASRIEAVLEKKEKLLIILDDIWRGIEFDKVGIPFGDGSDKGDDDDHNKYCKILMSSRSENVLCNEMGSTSNFFLQVLSHHDAWNLFEKTLGGVRKDPSYQSVAAEVVEKCSGIPILLVTIAKALRNKELVTWNDAVSQLKRCHPDNFVKDAYLMIEVSYNFLNGEEIKSLFLLCGQMDPGDILIEYLLKYTMGLGLFNGREKLKDASDRLHTYLRDLKDCCLLEDDDDEEKVKMHDVVHKFSAYVGERDHQMFSVADGELQKWPPKNKLEQFTAISLPYCQLPPPDHQLPAAFDNSKLESFLLLRNNCDASLKVPDNFFIGMKGLKLVDLTRIHLSLPSSLSALIELRTLCLDYCVLNDIAIIGELPMLQVLSLVGSSIVKLPAEIGKLGRSLQLLDLRFCSKLEVIAPGVLSKLTLLEELRIEDSFNEWEQEGCSSTTETTSTEKKASLGELKKLPNLINLDLHIPDASMFPKNLVLKKLERFRILIGEVDSGWDTDYQTSKSLKLELDEGVLQLDDHGIKVLMRTAEGLYLGKLKGFESLCELDPEGFPQLKHLNAEEEVEIQYIVKRSYPSNNCVVFPKLESLVLDNLPNLERIIFHAHMLPAVESLKNLTTIEVKSCNVLMDLFSSHLARRLLCLKEISVDGCESMETIVSIESENRISIDDQFDEDEEEEIIGFTQLRALKLHRLPRLTSFYSNPSAIIPSLSARSTRQEQLVSEIVEENHELTSPTPLFNRKIAFPKLEELDLFGIRVEKIWDDQLAIEAKRTCWLQNLTSLIVDECENLSYLFTSSMVKSLAQLEKLEVRDSSSIKEIVATKPGEMGVGDKLLFPKLDDLMLGDLPELVRFCHANLIECPSLRKLRISNCPELKTFISTDDGSADGIEANSSILFCEKVTFPNLEELKVIEMEQLKMIWGEKLDPNSFSKLKDLQIIEAGGLLNVFPANMSRRAQNLESLKIIDCDMLEKIFGVQMPSADTPCTQKLRFVTVLGCSNLKSVFPASVALALQQLEELKIRNCKGMEEIVLKEEDGISGRFVFPKLTSLQLLGLPQLQKFYPAPHVSHWPSLNMITVRDCGKIDISDASFAKIISNSKECHLEIGNIRTTYKLLSGELTIDGHGHLVYPIALLERFQQLEKVVFSGFSLRQLFPCELAGDDDDVDSHARNLGRIQNLQLIRMKRMEHIWSEHSQVYQILQNLKSLEVRDCGSLISLAPPAALFKHLTRMDIVKCRKLKSLLTSATARSLVQLTEMRVSSCSSLMEIVANVGDEASSNKEIVFSKLEKLTLHSLASLKSFCSTTSCTFKFPSMYQVIVAECPKMEFFFKGALSTPKLRRVQVNIEDEEQAHWDDDLDSTVRELSKELAGLHDRERLRLSEFPELNDMWLDEFPIKQSSYLKFLEVNECTFASYVISSGLLLSLNNLKDLRVTNCNSLGEIFDGSKELELRNRNVGLLSKLRKFYLADLPSLRHVWPQNFEGTLVFQNLTLLTICNCSSLRYVFTPSMAPCLVQLQKIQVENCALMEEIFLSGEKEKGMGDGIVLIFPELDSIFLQSLPCLASFYYGNSVLDCPCLENITVIDCPKMEMFISPLLKEKELINIKESHKRLGGEVLYPSVKALFSDKVVFPNLEELKLVGMDGLKMIWKNDHELHPDSFFSLKTLEVRKGASLLSIFPPGMLGRYNNLENLTISKCESLEVVFDVRLDESTLVPLPSTQWNEDSHGLISFQNLRSVRVEECPSLPSLFPVSIALGLQQLEILHLETCERIEEIVSKKEDGQREESFRPEFVFPNVTGLTLWKLPELKRFYKGSYVSEWPKLDTLFVYCCEKIDIFGEACGEEHQQPFLSITKVVPNLEDVCLRSTDIKMICDQRLVMGNKLKILDLRCFHDGSQFFPLASIQRFPNLDKFMVSCSDFKQLFSSQLLVDETNVKTLARIPHIEVHSLDKMTHIWDAESDQLDQILQNLEYLQVCYCNSLINLAPSTALFQNLTYLEVNGCKQLITLMASSSTAKSFVQLTEMRISECDSLTEIVAIDHGEESSNEDIVFDNLEKLVLQSLTSLANFCYAKNCNFKFPSLYQVTVAECPKMEFFSKGALTTPNLKGVKVNKPDEDEKERWEGNLDYTVQQLYKEMTKTVQQLYKEVVCSRKQLKISEFPVLKNIWLNELPVHQCRDLRSLEVDECPFVSYAISLSLLLSLHNLEELRVTKCNSLEKVFDRSVELELRNSTAGKNVGFLSNLKKFYLVDLRSLRHVWPGNHVGISSFKNLSLLDIYNCSSLMYVFTPSMTSGLVHLLEIQVKKCAGLETIIFIGEKEEETGDDNNLIFPQLSSLLLESLPCLTSFYPGNGVLDCPGLEKITVIDCPKMEAFTSTTQKEKEVTIIGENHETLDNKDLHASIEALFNDKVAFPKLEELTLEKNMDGVKRIWGNELRANSFSKLKTLKIEDGRALLNIFPPNMLRRGLLNLENLTVCCCNSLEVVFDIQKMIVIERDAGEGASTPTKLTTITMRDLPKLKHVWNQDPNGLVSFQNLRSVSAKECPILTSLFPLSVAQDLQQLELLEIYTCKRMEEIVVSTDVDQDTAPSCSFVFPKVTSLTLWILPELKRFYPRSHTSEWPTLKTFWIQHCDKINVFVPSPSESGSGQSISQDDLQLHHQSFLSFSKIIPNLEQVSLRSKDVEMICDNQGLFTPNKLKVLELKCFHDRSKVFPVALFQELLNLEKLIVRCSNFKLLFSHELLVADESNAKTLARIPKLKLQFLPLMTHIWDEKCNNMVQNLQLLEVWECHGLINLAPSTTTLFPNLTSLDVRKCKSLVKLLASSSNAKSLVQLVWMRIRECDSLTEIVASDHGDEATRSNIDVIVFPKLRALVLQSLTSLTSFCCATNYSFEFPSLALIVAAECPKMEFFCQGVLITPKLKRVLIKKEGDNKKEVGRWEGDLNSTVRQLYKEKNSSTI